LLPDDHPQVPPPGSAEQERMIALIEGVYAGDFERSLDVFLDVPFSEVNDCCVDTASALLGLGRGDAGPPRVLDLGAGIGTTAARFVRSHGSAAEVRVHDLSPRLLERARQQLGDEFSGVPIDTVTLDLLCESLSARLGPQSHDVVLASNVLHLLPRERQAEVIADVYELLSEGGVFASVLHLKILAPAWKTRIRQQLRAWWLEAGLEPEAFEQRVVPHFERQHTHTTLPAFFGALQRAGFRLYDCPYRRFIYGVVVAVK
ncbi:MAG: class I SAM-dependent methyltransferase, partial [Myxococcales bacterium]|nr:class I SAM-dependent methyltransferase [Myxococcales bacterium]